MAPEPIRQRLPYKSDNAARDEANRKLGRAARCSIGHALPLIRPNARSAGLTVVQSVRPDSNGADRHAPGAL